MHYYETGGDHKGLPHFLFIAHQSLKQTGSDDKGMPHFIFIAHQSLKLSYQYAAFILL